jgi:8-oxo-dGTP diphosphatase
VPAPPDDPEIIERLAALGWTTGQPIPSMTRLAAYGVIRRDGRVLLCRVAPGNLGEGRWTLPGGGLQFGEAPAAAAVREVEEETGLRVELGRVIGVDSTRWDRAGDGSPIDTHALHIVYTAEVVGGSLRHEVGGSTDRAEWVPLADLADRPHIGLVDLGLAAAGLA